MKPFANRWRRCPHICKREVINMLVAEYDYDTDITVQREEAGRIAFAERISQGSYQTKLETAKLMKQANCEPSFIQQMTGLSVEEIEKL